MPQLSQFAVFFAAALLLAVMPGPGIFYVATRTLAGGRAEGVASTCGTGLGGMVHVCAGSLGVSAIVLASAQLFVALKFIGAVYLVWLGIRTFRSARRDALALAYGGSAVTPVGRWRALRQGVLVEALNPKTAAFFLSFIPQFVDPAAGHVALQFLALGFVSVTLNILTDLSVTFAANLVRTGMASRPTRLRRLREASGVAMVGLGLGLLMTKRTAA